ALRELEREHDLRELALAVRTYRVVATLEHDVVEVDRRLPRGGDVDDTRRHGATKQRQEKVREQERGEVVDGEPELVAGDRGRPRGGDVDDTRRHGATKQRQEKVREQERGEVVDGEPELVAVCA